MTIKSLLKIILVVVIVLFIFYHFFYYIDIQQGCFITIKPSLLEFNNTTLKKGIKHIQQKSPQDYVNLCQYIDTINPNFACGGFGGGCYSTYNSNPKEIEVSTAYGDVIGAAGVIVHELCHAMQYARDKELKSFNEDECYKAMEVIDERFIRK